MRANNYMKIDIGVREYFGSNNAAIVFGRLMYWFSKKPDGFYKFKQPCEKHPLYKKGDSWGEELGMSRKMLDPILNRLVCHHKTKRAYMQSDDKFSGKMFCSYTNHKTSQTYYFVNREAVERFMSSISPKNALPSPTLEVSNSVKQPKNMATLRPSDVPNEQPLVCARQQPINTQTITSLSGGVHSNDNAQKEQEKLISKKMVELWNSHADDTVVWLPSLAAKLCKALYEHFKGCLEIFKNYCETVGSSLFLTGKSQSKFRAFLFWAIKPEVIQSILRGAYGVKSFFTMTDPEEKKINDSIKNLDNQISLVESHISHSEEKIKASQNRLVQDIKANLTLDEKIEFREESDKEYYENHPTLPGTDEAILKIVMNVCFEAFLDRKIKERLAFSDTILAPQELVKRKASLIFERYIRSQELNELHQMKRSFKGLILSPNMLSKI